MTWANLVRKWVGYENQEVQLSTNNSQEEIIDQWLMVDISKNETTLVDILDEALPTEEQLARRKLWKKRLEKASKSCSSPTIPPRARVLKKHPKQTIQVKKSKSRKRSRKATIVVEEQQPITSDQAKTTTSNDEQLTAQSSSSITQSPATMKKQFLPHIYRGYVNNHCRLSNFTKSTQIQHNRCIQQPMKKN
jgi:hypothetical protein